MTQYSDTQKKILWDQILDRIRKTKDLAESACTHWLKPLQLIRITDDLLELGAPNDYARDRIKERYIPFISDAASLILQSSVKIDIISLEQNLDHLKDESNYEQTLMSQQMNQIKRTKKGTRKSNSRYRSKKRADDLMVQQPTLDEATVEYQTNKTAAPVNPGDSSSLNPKYTFDTFVTGDSNSFAYAAAMAIAENPAQQYNPFFMYGGVGLGKTHLMHAIGHHILQKDPTKRVLYVSSETFVNELIRSMMNKNTIPFREKYRNIDVLLVDDVQFFAGKKHVQEEFFHTFNVLKDLNNQIILSCDRHPKEIGLDDRLCSRFEGGLLADVQAPDLETRIAILKKKILLDRQNVPEDVVTYIASRIDSNVRELEGALTCVVAKASVFHCPITYEMAVEVLKNNFKQTQPSPQRAETEHISANIESIRKTVAQYVKLTIADLNGKKRSRSIAYPRQIAMYLCREMTEFSLPRIGNSFGGRDHTTVMHAHDKIKKQYADSNKTAQAIDEIKSLIGKN